MGLPAGLLQHRIQIQSKATTVDSFGQPTDTWSTTYHRWASVEPLQGREFFAADQINSEVSARIRIRYQAGITAGMRVLFGSLIYNIEAVINPKMDNEEMQLMCSEGVNSG